MVQYIARSATVHLVSRGFCQHAFEPTMRSLPFSNHSDGSLSKDSFHYRIIQNIQDFGRSHTKRKSQTDRLHLRTTDRATPHSSKICKHMQNMNSVVTSTSTCYANTPLLCGRRPERILLMIGRVSAGYSSAYSMGREPSRLRSDFPAGQASTRH